MSLLLSSSNQRGKLSESDTFTFECSNNNGNIILGYSTINTNRISMKVDCKCDGDVSPISFSTSTLKEIPKQTEVLNLLH